MLNYGNLVNTGSLYLYACCRVVIFRRSKLELRTRTYVTGYVGCILMKISVNFFLAVSQLQAPNARYFIFGRQRSAFVLGSENATCAQHIPIAETRSRANQKAENQMNFHLCAPKCHACFPLRIHPSRPQPQSHNRDAI